MGKIATLIGKIKTIEANLDETTKLIDQQFTTFSNAISYIEDWLKEISTKEKLKTISKIEKQEVTGPLTKLKNSLDLAEKHLNKILNTIKDSKFNEEETCKLQQIVNEVLSKYNDYKQKLDPLFDKLKTIQSKITTIKETIDPYDCAKEKDKFLKHLEGLISHFNQEVFADQKQNKEILSQLKVFKHKIKPLSISTESSVSSNSVEQHSESTNSPRPTTPTI